MYYMYVCSVCVCVQTVARFRSVAPLLEAKLSPSSRHVTRVSNDRSDRVVATVVLLCPSSLSISFSLSLSLTMYTYIYKALL